MNDPVPLKPSELKSFLKFEGSYSYSLQRFVSIGCFRSALLLQDNALKKDVLAKIVVDFNEGEFTYWPHLRHENVILLLDMVPLRYQKTIFVFTFLEKSLKTAVTEASFKLHPRCFDRKRSYAKDVLSGLEYLHQKSLSLMNLDGDNVLIYCQTDKAVISDLSRTVSTKTTRKIDCPTLTADRFPPETEDGSLFECNKLDIWNCGVLFLQMFTMNVLPWCQVLEMDYFEGISTELLRHTNPGANLQDDTVNSLKTFLAQFLQIDPQLRVSAKSALTSVFLQNSRKRIDEEAREFWEAYESGKLMSVGKFGEITVFNKTENICWKRRDLNKVKFKESVDFSLENSKIDSDFSCIAEELKKKFYPIATCKDTTAEVLPSKKISCSEENLLDFLDWIYDSSMKTCGVSQEEKETKSKCETNQKYVADMQQTPTKMPCKIPVVKRNSQDSSKFQENSEITDSVFDLPCRCVFCTGEFDQEDPLKLIQFWSYSDIPAKNCADALKQPSSSPFIQSREGFLNNDGKPVPQKENATKQLNENDLLHSWKTRYNDLTEGLDLRNTTPENLAWPSIVENHKENSERATRKQYLDNNFAPEENNLMFQRCTGFRKGSMTPQTTLSITSKTPEAEIRKEELNSRKINKVKPKRTTMHAPDNTVMDDSRFKKGNTSLKKKESEANNPKAAMETRSENSKVVDISMELPLCSENIEKEKSVIVLSRNKPKQKWIRVFCPGSVLEGKPLT